MKPGPVSQATSSAYRLLNTNYLRLVIDDKVLDVANLTVSGLDVAASHIMRAAQMCIPHLLTLLGFSPLFVVTYDIRIRSPNVWDTIHRPSVILVVCIFELPRDRLVAVQSRTVLNPLFGQIDVDVLVFSFTPTSAYGEINTCLSVSQDPVSATR